MEPSYNYCLIFTGLTASDPARGLAQEVLARRSLHVKGGPGRGPKTETAERTKTAKGRGRGTGKGRDPEIETGGDPGAEIGIEGRDSPHIIYFLIPSCILCHP